MDLHTLPDSLVVALTIWGEARGEAVEGQIAVACVIRNRQRAKGGFWRDICLADEQFSCFNEDDVNARQIQRAAVALTSQPLTPELAQAVWIADGVIDDVVKDLTLGATHYLTSALLKSSPPAWAKDQPVLAVIGAHSFLKVA